jgi:hypothetical protein
MLSLPVITWIRFLVWLDIGVFIYWFYGRKHSPLADAAEQRAQSGGEVFGNLLTMLGSLTLFNGFFIALLGLMTGRITTEATAKWHEIGVTPESADRLGFAVLAVGLVVLVIGRLVARSGSRPAAV